MQESVLLGQLPTIRQRDFHRARFDVSHLGADSLHHALSREAGAHARFEDGIEGGGLHAELLPTSISTGSFAFLPVANARTAGTCAHRADFCLRLIGDEGRLAGVASTLARLTT